MSEENFNLNITVDKTPQEAYEAINNVREWWSQGIEGKTTQVGDVFYYHYKDLHHSVIKITNLVPGKKVVWRILHNDFSFIKDKTEWINNDVIFEISEKDGKTEINFTHVGLTPKYECYEACSGGWGTYILGSLKDLINTGKGEPNEGEARNETESKLEKGEEL